MYVHRDYPGEHVASSDCWCQPVVVDETDERDGAEIAASLEAVKGS